MGEGRRWKGSRGARFTLLLACLVAGGGASLAEEAGRLVCVGDLGDAASGEVEVMLWADGGGGKPEVIWTPHVDAPGVRLQVWFTGGDLNHIGRATLAQFSVDAATSRSLNDLVGATIRFTDGRRSGDVHVQGPLPLSPDGRRGAPMGTKFKFGRVVLKSAAQGRAMTITISDWNGVMQLRSETQFDRRGRDVQFADLAKRITRRDPSLCGAGAQARYGVSEAEARAHWSEQ